MKLKIDGLVLPFSRATELEVTLDTGDTMNIITASGNISIKNIEGSWIVFPGKNIEIGEPGKELIL